MLKKYNVGSWELGHWLAILISLINTWLMILMMEQNAELSSTSKNVLCLQNT
jgi:hypothetical protein